MLWVGVEGIIVRLSDVDGTALARLTGVSNEGVPLVVGTSEVMEFPFVELCVNVGTSTCEVCGEWDGMIDVLFESECISEGVVEDDCGIADVISLLGANDGARELDFVEFVGGELELVGGELGDATDDIVGRAMDIYMSQSSLFLILMISLVISIHLLNVDRWGFKCVVATSTSLV